MISSRVSVSGGRPTRRADRDGPRSVSRWIQSGTKRAKTTSGGFAFYPSIPLVGDDAMPPTQVRGHGGHLGEDLVSMRQHMSFGSLCLRPHLRGHQAQILLVQDLDVASVGAEQQVNRQILPLYGAGAEANLVCQVHVESQRPTICPHPMVDVVGPPLPEIAIRQGTPRQPETAYTPCFLDFVEDDGVRGRPIEQPADELMALAGGGELYFLDDCISRHEERKRQGSVELRRISPAA